MSHAVLLKCFKEATSCYQRIMSNPVHHHKLVSGFKFDMTKEDIIKCNVKYFNDKVYVISTDHDEHKQQAVIKKLMEESVLGFDTETRVIFDKPEIQLPISLIQIATKDIVVLWRLRKQNKLLWKNGFPLLLKNILQNNNIKKVGTGTDHDLKGLFNQYQITVSNLFDTQKIAKDLGFIKLGLASLSAQLFGWRISKSKRLSNWEVAKLDAKQISYAATDAWASLLVFNELNSVMEKLNMLPAPLPSVYEAVLHEEMKNDHKIFHQLDKKLSGCDTKQYGVDHEKSKKTKLRKRKIDCAVFDLDVHSHTDFLDKESRLHSSYEYDYTTAYKDNRQHYCERGLPREAPYIHQQTYQQTYPQSPYIYKNNHHLLQSPYAHQMFPKPI